MEQLYIFGTGNATVTHCYNTCFALKGENEYFMVDAGGGNGILSILEAMNVPLSEIHHIFVSHEHSDHILGMVWMIRMIGQRILKNSYDGNLFIYCHKELTETLLTLCKLTLQAKIIRLIGERIQIIPISDQETKEICGWNVTFFDIHSTKAKQFGFFLSLSNKGKFVFCGDEPLKPELEFIGENADWLCHEAFCLYKDRERFQPYEKHHSTALDAAKLADSLHVQNLILWHTEDKTQKTREAEYSKEAHCAFDGHVFVPNDRTILTLSDTGETNGKTNI